MVEELLGARGIVVSHETVRQWARKVGQAFANPIRRRLPAVGGTWHLDEVVILSATSRVVVSPLEVIMSLRLGPIGDVPAETARVAHAAFPKGTLVTRLRDEFSALYEDEDFRKFYSARGQPGPAPWRLALVTVLQSLEHLSYRQAADAVRARIDWKDRKSVV